MAVHLNRKMAKKITNVPFCYATNQPTNRAVKQPLNQPIHNQPTDKASNQLNNLKLKGETNRNKSLVHISLFQADLTNPVKPIERKV